MCVWRWGGEWGVLLWRDDYVSLCLVTIPTLQTKYGEQLDKCQQSSCDVTVFYSARRLQEGEVTHLPVVEDREAEGLSLCVRAQVCLKAKGVDGREESLDGVQGGPGHRRILRHVTSTNSNQNCYVRASK